MSDHPELKWAAYLAAIFGSLFALLFGLMAGEVMRGLFVGMALGTGLAFVLDSPARAREKDGLRRKRKAEKARAAELKRQARQARRRARQEHKEADQASPREWWVELGISPQASAEEIRRSYLAKIRQYHPDRVNGLASELVRLAELRTKQINEAFARAKRQR